MINFETIQKFAELSHEKTGSNSELKRIEEFEPPVTKAREKKIMKGKCVFLMRNLLVCHLYHTLVFVSYWRPLVTKYPQLGLCP